MGAGKSTIGKLLASRLQYGFADTDHLIEERTGADIPWIFDVEGESGFRNREENVLAELCSRDKYVIATGGGIVEREKNRRLLEKNDNVFYLTASIELLMARTFKDKKRPLLQVSDPKSKMIELLEYRDPLFRQVSSHVIVTDGMAPKAVAHKIAEIYL